MMKTNRIFEAMGGFEECPALVVPMLQPQDLKNTTILRGLRWSAFLQNVQPANWLDHASNLYRDFPGAIVDAGGNETMLDMTPLEEASVEWWRDTCCRPCNLSVVPHVRREATERVIVLGTILRASSLAQAYLWGIGQPANTNAPPKDQCE